MWCDNCLLIFPLRAGAMALLLLIALYSIGGSIFLFMYGQYLYFTYPEPQLYGGVGMVIGALAVIHLLAYSNQSYMFVRLLFYLGPFVLFLAAARAGLMVFRLDQHQEKVLWECQNGGQLYNATIANLTPTNLVNFTAETAEKGAMPAGFCTAGFQATYLAFAIALVVDIVLQVYNYFMLWRYKARLEGYAAYKLNGSNVYVP